MGKIVRFAARRVWLRLALAVFLILLVGGTASAETRQPEVTQTIPLSPLHLSPFRLAPPAGSFRFAWVELGEHMIDGGTPSRAAGRLDLGYGLTNFFGLRLALPIVGTGQTLAVGSALAAASISLMRGFSTFRVRLIVEGGLVLPSAAAPFRPAAALPLSTERVDFEVAPTLIIAHESGLALTSSVHSSSFGAELAFGPRRSAWAIRGGLDLPFADGESISAVFGATSALSKHTELAVFAAIPIRNDGVTVPHVGFGVRFDLSTLGPRSFARESGDLRQITPSAFKGIAAVAVIDKVTVLELGAAWCGPCRIAEPRLIAMAKADAGLAVRFIDVDDVDVTAAIDPRGSIPRFIVFAPDGHEVARVTGWNEKEIRQQVERGRRR